ncbi:hypothetical protein H257_08877 [Aphanomyces astaci]|uniref:Uncharacterized protein n=1 Tax=Aphanomyces astaci TaxID=112090 RepID=W4GCQ1_APHAT|nr:hypothetical protein H257_08877 [Aphanomyces astaci]ETV77462.1 hypothetical protein H257_08877 [Aphanomyces astaci]|eukprot:XP_009833249.1 hypothetical protein H257_08877 [Aphanomyces astaci]
MVSMMDPSRSDARSDDRTLPRAAYLPGQMPPSVSHSTGMSRLRSPRNARRSLGSSNLTHTLSCGERIILSFRLASHVIFVMSSSATRVLVLRNTISWSCGHTSMAMYLREKPTFSNSVVHFFV